MVDKKDYAAQAEERKKELNNKVLECAKNFTDNPENILEFIKFQSKFYKYSAKNTMLIQAQNPNAVFCGSFKHFKDKGYSIKKGEKSMQIFVPTLKTFIETPDGETVALSDANKQQKEDYKLGKLKSHQKLFFKVGNVFDISQTDCPKEEYPKYLDLGYPSEVHAELFYVLKRYSVEQLNCPVEEDAYSSVTLRGLFSPTKNEIKISGNFDDTTKLSILSHELGHAIIHNIKAMDGNSRPTAQVEFEADAVSVMLYSKFNLEISDSRQAHLAGVFKQFTELKEYKPKMLTESLERANNAYKSVSDYINDMSVQNQQIYTNNIHPTNEPILPNQISGGGITQTM